MNLIVAVDKNWAIGNKGDLLARIRADLMNFKRITDGKIVVLGSNTLATFPGGRPLKNRINIVLHPSPDYRPEGAVVVHSLEELFRELKKHDTNDVFVIGGASVYKQLLPFCDTAYITKFEKSFEYDAALPDLDKDENWYCSEKGALQYSDPETDTEGGLPFYFTLYKRKQNH
jgi:dihydrofolate reductase